VKFAAPFTIAHAYVRSSLHASMHTKSVSPPAALSRAWWYGPSRQNKTATRLRVGLAGPSRVGHHRSCAALVSTEACSRVAALVNKPSAFASPFGPQVGNDFEARVCQGGMNLRQPMANSPFFVNAKATPSHQTEDRSLISQHQLHIENRILFLETMHHGDAVDAGAVVKTMVSLILTQS